VYAYRAYHPQYIDSLFYTAVHGLPRSRVVVLETGQKPPPGAVVVGAVGDCATGKPLETDAVFEAYHAN
jgi:hypothetical protein